MIHQVEANAIKLARCGTHADLCGRKEPFA